MTGRLIPALRKFKADAFRFFPLEVYVPGSGDSRKKLLPTIGLAVEDFFNVLFRAAIVLRQRVKLLAAGA
ncbi:MAG: hypothetical protein HY525_08965 [Betaproteobacteria bacterium]|nr:hypothetical protein [Betaproteobacteria bacterium]